METEELFKPKFTGQRFNDHTLPFELLDDLSVYQELIIQVAKDLYYEQTQNRRVPNGFGQGVYLKLGSLEQGSTIPKILIAAASFICSGYDAKPLFQKAQERIVQTIAAAENGANLKTLLSPDALSYFNRIGKDLRDDENINFGNHQGVQATLNQANRQKLVMSSPTATTFESNVHVRGVVSALSKDPFQITIQTKERVKLNVEISRSEFEIASDAFSQFENQKRVLISGIGVFNKQNKLDQVKSVKSIVILDSKDVPTKLEEFYQLNPGWHDGEGSIYTKTQIMWLSNCFDNYFDRSLLLPFTFPTPDNGVEFEWVNNEHDATLEVDLEAKSGYYHYSNSQFNDRFEDAEIDLSTVEGWEKLNTELAKHFKAPIIV